MPNRLMSDAEIRRRKKAQGHVSQITGGLGLAALGGTLAASRGGRNTLRKIPQLKNRIKAPPPKDPNRDKIKGAVTPVLATSAGLGGASSFNFAAYTNAESRKRKQTVVKCMGVEMGYYGEEGHPVKPPEIKVPIEKAWTPSASNFSSEEKRKKRGEAYQTAAAATGGASGVYAGHQGVRAVKEGKKVAPRDMAPVTEKVVNASGDRRKIPHWKSPGHLLTEKAVPVKHLAGTAKHTGKAALGVAGVGAAAGIHGALKRKEKGSWQPYAKRNTTSAFGVSHV